MPALKLFTRGMLIVFVPLVCQIIFVCALVCLLLNVQDQVALESHSRDLLNRAYGFAIDAFYSLGQSALEQNPNSEKRASATLMHQRLKEFADLANSDHFQEKRVAKFLRLGEKGTGIIETVEREKAPDGSINSDKLDIIMVRAAMVFSSLLDTVIEIDHAEQAATAASSIASTQLRTYIWSALAAMLIASVAGAVILGIFYANSIKAPLQRLRKNSRLLSRREPLLAQIAGKDEFAQLDRLLHSLSGAVEQALQEEREMLSNAGDMICSLDESGRILSVNPFTEKILGEEAHDVIGRSWLDFVYKDDYNGAAGQLQTARANQEKASFELRLRGAGGQLIDSRWTVLWSEAQKIWFCIVHDVTEQRNLAKLKQDYINMVSHDLRSPLMSVHASMILLARGNRGDLAPAVQQEVLEAAKSIDVLSNLIGDLLDLQKLQSGKMQLDLSGFMLHDLFRQSKDLVLPLAEAKNLAIVLPSNEIGVLADQGKLRQCIVNLLANAIKFSPPNSKVVIEAATIGDDVEVRVIDMGPGVPEKYRQKIFEAFEQVPAREGINEEGSGLGLAICKLVAEAHDGTVGVRVPEGFRGSIFWLRIPISQQK